MMENYNKVDVNKQVVMLLNEDYGVYNEVLGISVLRHISVSSSPLSVLFHSNGQLLQQGVDDWGY